MKYLNNKDSYYLGEEIPDIDLFFAQIWLSCFTNEFKTPSGRAFKKVLSVWRGYHLWFYYGEEDSHLEGEYIVNKFVKKPKFATQVNKQIIVEADKLRDFADSLPYQHLNKLSNQKLWQIYNKFDQIHTHYYKWCWIPVAVDMFHNNFTERAKQYLRGINVTEDMINEYLVLLTQPVKKSLIQIEQEEFFKIALYIQKDKYHKKLFKDLYKLFEEKSAGPLGLGTHTLEYENLLENRVDDVRDKIKLPLLKLVEKHYNKYFYVKFMWIGKEGVYSFDYYLKELIKFVGQESNTEKLLKQKELERQEISSKRSKLIKKLKINRTWKILFNNWGDFMVTKIYRRYAQIYALYKMQPILREIAKRLKITEMQVKFMITQEIGEALLKSKINRAELKKRTKFCVHYTEKNYEKVFTGVKARKLVNLIKEKELGDVKVIKGQTGCIGKARGHVKLIIRPKDMVKMKKGDVLVSIATDPDIVPAMKKASAIITEQGGVTSHAAIVSREMNIPCVIGTKIATKVLNDGDLVEVDANKGIIKKI